LKGEGGGSPEPPVPPLGNPHNASIVLKYVEISLFCCRNYYATLTFNWPTGLVIK